MADPPAQPIAVEGHNCWRRVRAGRAAFLIDGADYFAALADALERAQRSIWIVGWDLHSRLRLRRGDGPDEGPELRALLERLIRRRRRLHVNLLAWDFAMIYALERESLPVYRLAWQTPRRIHFRLDGEHPLGASHHQKIVVVDDALAFLGGLDLTASRWDTREHRPDDPRRSDPWQRQYPPFHDVQLAVDGDAAAALGELVRQRWQRAGGKRLSRVRARGDPWPEGLVPDLRDVPVALALTQPAWKQTPERRDVEQLTCDAIAAARSLVYIENQYLTSGRVGEALAQRLREPDGPEVVIVGPRECSGWLEEVAMGVLRTRLLRRLREADRHGRLRVYYPRAADEPEVPIQVHAKVMVVDDRLARVGSANLSNRSMGLDTECDAAIESCGDAAVKAAIAGFRDGLVAEHLGVSPEQVAALTRECGGLGASIERLRGGGRSLVPLRDDASVPIEEWVPDARWLDPERPIAGDALLQQFLPDDPGELVRHPALRVGLGVLALLGLAALWHFTSLSQWLEPERLQALAEPLRASPLGPLAAVGAFVVGGFAMVPVVALIVASALVFGPWLGFVWAMAGSMLSAAATYAAGRWLWRDTVRRLAGPSLNRLSRVLGRRGVLAVATVRVVPVAPFSVVNVVAGCTHIRFRDYLLGTFLGMLPGTLALTLLARSALDFARDPGGRSLAVLGAVAVVALLAMRALRRRMAEEGAGDSAARGAAPSGPDA